MHDKPQTPPDSMVSISSRPYKRNKNKSKKKLLAWAATTAMVVVVVVDVDADAVVVRVVDVGEVVGGVGRVEMRL